MAKEVRAERRLNTDSVSFRFARVAGQAKDDASAFDPTSGAVLLTFQLDRVGKEVRITDHDGSVYVGSLLASNSSAIFSASQAPLVAGSKVAQPSDRGMAPTPSARGYAFRASGNNLTWKQQVVITGALSQTNNLAVFRGNVVVGGRSNKRIEAVEQEP